MCITHHRRGAVQVLVVFIVVANCKSASTMCDIISTLQNYASGQGLGPTRLLSALDRLTCDGCTT